MKKVTVWLEEVEAKAITSEAKKRGVSFSQAARERMFSGTNQGGNFEMYRADQQEAFQRLLDLMCDMIATQKLTVNICSQIYGKVNPENAVEVLKGLTADFERLKKEAREHV